MKHIIYEIINITSSGNFITLYTEPSAVGPIVTAADKTDNFFRMIRYNLELYQLYDDVDDSPAQKFTSLDLPPDVNET